MNNIPSANEVIVECACKGCATRAKVLGKSFPLQAIVSEKMANAVGKNTHPLVELAYHPVLALSAGTQSGIWAVA